MLTRMNQGRRPATQMRPKPHKEKQENEGAPDELSQGKV